jgi:hypothetical protein
MAGTSDVTFWLSGKQETVSFRLGFRQFVNKGPNTANAVEDKKPRRVKR